MGKSREANVAREKEKTNALNIKAGIFSVCVALSLFIFKIIISLISGSISLLASALDSALDFLSSGVNLYAIKHAQKPADTMHRFGHGKAEALAGFIQSIVIFGSGLFLIYESVRRFFYPKEIKNTEWAIIVMIISIVLTFVLVQYQKMVQKKSKSMVIAADRLHYVTDLLSNLAVLISLGLSKLFSITIFDTIAALGVAIYIMKSSSEIFKQSFDILMDRDISDIYREDLKQVMENSPHQIIGYHDLRSRSAGDIDFLEFHLELPSRLKIVTSHEIVENIMFELKKKHPKLEIIIHTDPAEVDTKSGKIKLYDREKPRFY